MSSGLPSSSFDDRLNITYKQLFGYGIWGTLWRVLIVFGVIVYAIDSLMSLLFGVSPSQSEQSLLGNNKYLFASIQLGYGLVLLALGWLIDLVARKTNANHAQKRANASEDKA